MPAQDEVSSLALLALLAQAIPIVGVGKERRILMKIVRNYLELYWHCAGELSTVSAIGTQLRDPINSGLTRWRMAI